MSGEDSHTGDTEVAEDDGWIFCGERLPPVDTDVETRVHDAHGIRNHATLKFYHGLWWWFPDMSMHVYYSPTHWRPLQSESSAKSAVAS